MFRVPEDTVLRRTAATALILLTTALTACGGDDEPETGVAPPTATTTAAATTPPDPVPDPADTTPVDEEPARAPSKKEVEKAQEETDRLVEKAAADANATDAEIAKVSPKPENDATIKKADKTEIADGDIDGQVATATKALETAKLQAAKVEVSGDAKAAIQVANTTVIFYGSERQAAKEAQKFQSLISKAPDLNRIVRRTNRLYLLSTAQKIGSADMKSFRATRRAVETSL